MYRAGVDTGGTFTDFVFYKNGYLKIKKVISTPSNPAVAVLNGLEGESCVLIHGTTVATNAFLEGKTAPTALITTAGFRNLLQIGRQTRVNLYSINPQKPPEVIPEELCFDVEERMLADGSVQIPLNEEHLKKIASELKKRKVKAIAIVFLHSYKNPEHEKRAGEILGKDFKLSLSHEVLKEHREYERAVVTALNASLHPVMEKYISTLEKKLSSGINIMNSAGGYISAEMAKKMPVLTLLSGPAGGVIASHSLAKLLSIDRVITLDMGGTSTDVSLIKDNPTITRSSYLANLPIRLPMIEIQTVGAGGGSIAYVDEGGALKVGPKSAGAEPGPACYGKSEIPTITDALVVLGRIPSEIPLGGNLFIKPERSFKAIEKIAGTISRDVYQAAEGILGVSLAKMERALRVVSLERGEDPKEFSLIAFGGAGGLVAAELAQRIGIGEVVIPPYQGVFSAFGMLLAEAVKEYTSSILKTLGPRAITEAKRVFREMEQSATQDFTAMGLEKEKITFQRFAEMRYKGQGYEVSVAFIDDPEKLKKAFEEEHKKLYYHTQNSPVEIVNIRLRVVGFSEKPPIPEIETGYAIPFRKRDIFFGGEFHRTCFYRRESLGAGVKLEGPSVIASSDGTVFIPPGFTGEVGRFGEIRIRRNNV